MHAFLLGVTFVIALVWVLNCIDMAQGSAHMPVVHDVLPLKDSDCPAVSLLFAARDEEEKLPGALKTFLALDYPRYEIVAVDDRSQDGTAKILQAAAQHESRLRYVRIDSLPPGWLGKPHALQRAYEESHGEWLVFTDADVHFSPDLLRKTVTLAIREGWGHLTLLSKVETHSFGEKVAITFFGMGFAMGVRPWRTSNPRSSAYTGVGAFQLIRRSAYEAMGTHRRLAMEVVDDMKLGKLVKQAGICSGVGKGWDEVRVRWHAGVGNIVRGTTKNFFATSGYNLALVIVQLVATLSMFVLPWVLLPLVRGWALAFDVIALAAILITHAAVCIEVGESPLYALTEPVGALIFCWMLARSTIVTLRNGGVEWRETFYSLKELKRGVV